MANRPGSESENDQLLSIEIDEGLHRQASVKLSDGRLKLLNGTSEYWLKEILLKEAKDANRILFWLDAHFPGAHTGIRSYADSMKMGKAISIPLEVELITIAENRDISNDVFIIDDLRIYESGNYKHGNYNRARKMFPGIGVDFFYLFNPLGDAPNYKRLPERRISRTQCIRN